ncbi:MAG: HDOD domain-containing protein [Granulosicoccaceae bacterium]
MSASLEELVDIAEDLVKFSASAMEINRIARDDDAGMPELIVAVEADPNFSMNILRIANSPVYLRGEPTVSVAQAITRIGRLELGQMAFAAACMEGMEALEGELLQLQSLWRDGMLVGGIARELCALVPSAREFSYAAGMLHSIGTMVLNSQLPERMAEAMRLSLDYDVPLYKAEKHLIGFTNATLGGALARRWNFPEPLAMAIEYQHCPEKAPAHKETVAVIAIASTILDQSLQSNEFADARDELEDMLDKLDIRAQFEEANLDASELFNKVCETSAAAA